MSNLSKTSRTRLYTTFGTVVYVDAASGEVRHGALDDSRANAVLLRDQTVVESPPAARLMYNAIGVLEPILFSAEGCWCSSSIKAAKASMIPNSLRVVQIGHEMIALQSGGLYLCAESDGRITLSRTKCSLWECFVASKGWCNLNADLLQGVDRDDPSIDWRAVLALRAGAGTPPAGQPDRHPSAPAESPNHRFTRRRVIVMRHRGNLANKMLQYMGALSLANRIKDCTIVNVSIPEWGIAIPDDTQNELFVDNVDLLTWDPFRPHIEELCAMANRSDSIRIMMADHLQRMEFLMRPQCYKDIFPNTTPFSYAPTENDLVINIRAAEVLDGVSHYPLLPVSFYEDIVARTGLNPVFVGQLTESEYVQELRRRFPVARFIDSQGARADFDLIRSSKHIVVAISTFSWVAAWLSEAETIILPLSGFYNPAHHREIDLLPIDDIRYRYFLFPLNYGLPQQKVLRYHERIKGRWKEISRNQVALLKNASPFLHAPRENYDSGLPTRFARGSAITFDPVWYAHQYVDAAMEISEGWFEDPLHHFLEVGRLRGYLPVRPMQAGLPLDLTLSNLALKKKATQSSRSEWSKGATLEEDAAYAVNGEPAKEVGFHTGYDPSPWWMLDLEDIAEIKFIRIFNRESVPEIQLRASPLLVEISTDAEAWTILFCTKEKQLFGGYKGGSPLVWSSQNPVEARFVRVSIPRQEYLHLAEVEVYGRLIGHDTLRNSVNLQSELRPQGS